MVERTDAVFIVGTGRCGTSITAESLAQHPLCCDFPFEPQIFYQKRTNGGIVPFLNGSADRDHVRKCLMSRFHFQPRRTTERGFSWFMTRQEYEAAIDRLLSGGRNDPAAARAFVKTVFSPYMTAVGAEIFIDSSPTNGLVIPDLVTLYPNGRFIHLIRDGRDVAKSFIRYNWAKDFATAFKRWECDLRATRKAGKAAGSLYREVLFSTLSVATEEIMRDLADFIGIEFDRAMLSPFDRERASQFSGQHSQEETDILLDLAPDLAEEFGWIDV